MSSLLEELDRLNGTTEFRCSLLDLLRGAGDTLRLVGGVPTPRAWLMLRVTKPQNSSEAAAKPYELALREQQRMRAMQEAKGVACSQLRLSCTLQDAQEGRACVNDTVLICAGLHNGAMWPKGSAASRASHLKLLKKRNSVQSARQKGFHGEAKLFTTFPSQVSVRCTLAWPSIACHDYFRLLQKQSLVTSCSQGSSSGQIDHMKMQRGRASMSTTLLAI